jgi:hypothetical protein
VSGISAKSLTRWKYNRIGALTASAALGRQQASSLCCDRGCQSSD